MKDHGTWLLHKTVTPRAEPRHTEIGKVPDEDFQSCPIKKVNGLKEDTNKQTDSIQFPETKVSNTKGKKIGKPCNKVSDMNEKMKNIEEIQKEMGRGIRNVGNKNLKGSNRKHHGQVARMDSTKLKEDYQGWRRRLKKCCNKLQ